MTELILTERHGAVARLVLNAPASMNAIGPAMARELVAASAALAADASVRAVIVTGAGAHFMAGGDIRYFAELLEQDVAARDAGLAALINDVGAAVTNLTTMSKPVIGAVRGAAAGFGFSLMCACDIVVASDTTTCKLAYGELGASPDGGGSFHLPRVVGVRRALEIALLDERIDAARAQALGLVTRVVADAALDEEAMALAQRLAVKATAALGRTKSLLRAAPLHDLATHLDAERRSFLDAAGSADFAEGVHAFLGKRKAQFRGN